MPAGMASDAPADGISMTMASAKLAIIIQRESERSCASDAMSLTMRRSEPFGMNMLVRVSATKAGSSPGQARSSVRVAAWRAP